MSKSNRSFAICLLLYASFSLAACLPRETSDFDGQQALRYAQKLMSFGDRIPGSPQIQETAHFIQSELTRDGWSVTFQDFVHQSTHLRNIIAKNSDLPPDVIIAAHYDTRALSDQETDPALQALPVPGADDGTSGTAVLMELARVFQSKNLNLWLVFFDGEDQGHIHDWDWSVGAQYFADHLASKPDAVVVIDMIGDSDLNVYREKQSTMELTDEIWNTAQSLGFENQIIDEEKYTMIDDHLPFLRLGIPSCLMIDFDYPYWHTRADTLDKISGESLYAIGQTLLTWLKDRR